jgi:glyceraldehyde-3-phosphate dehydrogenase (ferredoxin)
MLKELLLDNLGVCRFHRAWAEDLLPEIVEKIFGCKEALLTASRITRRNASLHYLASSQYGNDRSSNMTF